MQVISVSIHGTTASLAGEIAQIVCGNADYKLFCAFSAEWGPNITVHISYIQRGKLKTNVATVSNNVVNVPALSETELTAFIFDDGENVSDPLFIPCKHSIRDFSGKEVLPHIDQYDVLMGLLHEVEGSGDNA